MSALTFLPLDLKGTKVSNRVLGEQRTLVQVTNRPHRVLLPRMGAFFENSILKVYDQGQVLVKGVDYTTTYLYERLSELSGDKAVYAFIVILNPTVSNTVTIDYHAVGGPFGLDVTELQALLDAVQDDNFRVNYEDIINRPKAFNPEDHVDEYWQLYGAENTITVLERVKHLIGQRDVAVQASLQDYANTYLQMAADRLAQEQALFTQHVNDKQNPHNDTKTTVGLSELHNWRMATNTEHLGGLDLYYATPGGGLHVINNSVLPELNVHIANRNNPHGIRAQDVGAYTTAQQNNLLAQKLNRLDPAYDSNLIFGYTQATFKTYAMVNIPAENITEGLFADARLGTGAADLNTLLMGNGTWRTINSLMDEYNAGLQVSKIVVIRLVQASTPAAAIAYANTTFNNLTEYPVGTQAIYHADSGVSNFKNQWEVKFLIRNAGGWASYVP